MAAEKPAKQTFKTFLDKLVLPREVVVTDLSGKEWRVHSSVSARKTVLVSRHLQNAVSEPAVARASAAMDQLVQADDLAGAVVHAIGLVASEEVVGHLARAFGAAHPDVVRSAWEARPTYASNEAVPDDAAADLFALEELAAGVLPLFVGLARRSAQAFSGVVEAVQ